MDLSRSVKRLVVILALAIVAILVSKSLLSKAAKNLSIEAEKKQQAKTVKESATLLVSAVEETSASAIGSTVTVAMEPESAPVATESSAAIQ